MTQENFRGSTQRPYLPYSQSLAIGLITLCFIYVSALVLKPFFAVFTWALAFAVAMNPVATWLSKRIRSRAIASGVAVSLGALVFCLPTLWVTRVLAHTVMENVSSLISESGFQAWLDPSTAPPRLMPLLEWLEQSFHPQRAIADLLHSIANRLPQLLRMSLLGIVQFMLVLFTAFFFIRDGALFAQFLTWLSPLPPQETQKITLRVLDTIHACLFGIVLMSILQGALGVLIFWWLELPQPTLWGVVMGLLAILPYLGAFIVWIPTAFVLALHGEWTNALILVGWGSIVIGLADNFLYPVLVGKRLHYHSLLIFFFLLGGVVLFGSAGVVVGPMVLGVTHGLLELWQHQEEASASAPASS